MLRKGQIFLAVFFLSAGLLRSQAPQNQQRNRVDDYTIRGKIVIASQRDGDQRIEVRLEKSALQVIQTTYSDAAGNFDFRNLTPGSYYISVTLEGYEPVHQMVEIFNSFGNSSVTVFLTKPAIELRERLTGLDAADPDVVDVSQMKESLPKKAVQDYEKAIDEKQKGKIESAIKLLEEAVRLAPAFFHAHNNLGILYQTSKRYADAEREFRRSQELNARAERPLVNLGSLYIEQSNLKKGDEAASGELLDKALDVLEEAVKLNPRSAVGHLLLGQANYRSEFFEEAERAFKKVRDLDPKIAVARLMLANVYVKLQKWEEVIDNLDAYLKENPKAADRASVEQMRASIAKSMQAANLAK